MKTHAQAHNPATIALVSHETRIPFGATSQGALIEWTLGTTLGGAVIYTVNGQSRLAKPGRILLVRPRTLHHWRVVESPVKRSTLSAPWHVVYSVFHPRPHWHEWFNYAEFLPGFLDATPPDPAIAKAAASALLEVDRIARSTQRCRIELAMNVLERVLLLCWSARPTDGPTMDPRVGAAIAYLRDHLDSPISLQGLATACHCSRAHMALLFQRQTGIPPMQYHETIRIDRAMDLLRTTIDPIKTIARSVGFEDAKYFSKRFRKRAGVTPAMYRCRS